MKARADHGAVRERLAEAGAERRGAVRQADTYYAAPHRDLAATDEALRIRRERTDDGERAELTYKGPKVDSTSKTREEHESAVADPDAVDAALRALGFEPVATVEKARERFVLGEYAVTLDAVADLGEFVEVERAVDDEDAVAAARDGALETLPALGVDRDEGIRISYLGLLLGADEG